MSGALAVAVVTAGAPSVFADAPAAPVEAPLSSEQLYQQVSPSVFEVVSNLGLGTAFKVDAGFLTNAHVAENRQQLRIRASDGRMVPAQVVSINTELDLALLQADLNAPSLSLEDSTHQQTGEEVRAFGFPYALSNGNGPTVSRGLLSAIQHERLSSRVMLQTDAAMNPGNSGGPLVNMRGYVIGVDSHGYHADGAQGLNFAIGTDTVKQFLSAERTDAPPLYRGDAQRLAPRADELPTQPWTLVDENVEDTSYSAQFAPFPPTEQDQAAAGVDSAAAVILVVDVEALSTDAAKEFRRLGDKLHADLSEAPAGVDKAASARVTGNGASIFVGIYQAKNVVFVVAQEPAGPGVVQFVDATLQLMVDRANALAN